MIEFILDNIFWIILALWLWRTVSRAVAKAKNQTPDAGADAEVPAERARLVRTAQVLRAQRESRGEAQPSVSETRVTRLAEQLGVELPGAGQDVSAEDITSAIARLIGAREQRAETVAVEAPQESKLPDFREPLAEREARDMAERAAAFAFVPAEQEETLNDFLKRTGGEGQPSLEMVYGDFTAASQVKSPVLGGKEELRRAIILTEILGKRKALRGR
jgi:hypothetical protein